MPPLLSEALLILTPVALLLRSIHFTSGLTINQDLKVRGEAPGSRRLASVESSNVDWSTARARCLGRYSKAPKKTAKVKVKRGKRGALGKRILKFLSTKGKEGAHVCDIASNVGTKPINVTAWTYTTGKSKAKKVKPATFAIKE